MSAPRDREVFFEITRLGSTQKVAAIDGATGIEVTVVGPASAAASDLQQLALVKLKARLAKEGRER